jgi:hypothetical protein
MLGPTIKNQILCWADLHHDYVYNNQLNALFLLSLFN